MRLIVVSRQTNRHPVERSFQGVLTVAAKVGLVTSLQLSILQQSYRRVCGGGLRFQFC
jgi:hypothetical protein